MTPDDVAEMITKIKNGSKQMTCGVHVNNIKLHRDENTSDCSAGNDTNENRHDNSERLWT